MSFVVNEDAVYTYEEYALWPGDKRYELIEGVPRMMSAPTLNHQGIVLQLGIQYELYLRGKPCAVFISPCDVVLKEKNGRDTVVQPDVLVVCDPAKMVGGKKIDGAPDIVVEVLSATSARHDTVTKLNLYQKHGVKEYVIVYQQDAAVMQFNLADGVYTVRSYEEGRAPSAVLDGFSLDTDALRHALIPDAQDAPADTDDTAGEEK